MAPTIAIAQRAKIDNMVANVVNFTWDATYPAGGEAITANAVGMGSIFALIPLGSPGGATYEWDSTNAKLKAYYADYSTTTDGLLIEVAVGDTAILSGVVVPLLVLGT